MSEHPPKKLTTVSAGTTEAQDAQIYFAPEWFDSCLLAART